MWQNWALFYIGLWVAASAFVFGGGAKLNNLVFGFLIVLLSFWSGLKSRKLGPFSQ
jgi:uncharacterized membrane protein